MLEFVSLETAQNIIFESIASSQQIEYVTLSNCCGRILAKNLCAQINIPPFDRAAVDGYALNMAGTGTRDYCVIGRVAAGHSFSQQLSEGKCVRIFTGAPIPIDANTVVRQEDVLVEGDRIIVKKPVSLGDNIAFCGEDVKSGDLLLEQRTLLNPACVGILAAQGITEIPVVKKPMVGILSTGDELVFPGEPLNSYSIYNSNCYSLAALVEEAGAKAVSLGIVPDSLETISTKLVSALDSVDVVVTTGGASVGDYDLVKEAINQIGGDLLFWRIAIKPGTPVIAGLYQGKLILGLSGNPAAALIGAELLLAPLLRKLLGYSDYNLKTIQAVVNGEVDKVSGIRRMLRVRVEETETGLVAYLPDKQKSGILKSLGECNGVIDLAPKELIGDKKHSRVIMFRR